MSTLFRDSQIAVTARTRWALTRLARRVNKSAQELDTPASVDALAEHIISGWLDHNHQELNELWKRREAIDKEAEETKL